MPDDIPPQQITLSQPPKRRLPLEACPHWDNLNRSCLLVKDGLFLPIEQHVIFYCQSKNYPSCHHFQLLGGLGKVTGHNGTPPHNRRRSIRIPSRHLFRFSEIYDDGRQLPAEDEAWTIDLSEHGIRCTTQRPLSPTTTILFFLEVSDTATKIEGTGRVIWSEPLANPQGWQTGVAFTERTVSTLQTHLLHQQTR